MCALAIADSRSATPGAEPSWGREYLMCPPDHFEVAYSINPWMDVAVPVDRGRARHQWDELAEALRHAGAVIRTITARPGLPDMVFTANAGLVLGDAFVPASMRHAQRRGERAWFEAWFSARGQRIEALDPEAFQEGAGDALPFGGVLVAGRRQRSSAAAYEELRRRTGARVLALDLRDPRAYHVDLAFCPLGEGRAIVAPHALARDSRDALFALVDEPLVLDRDEAGQFCANSVVVGRRVIMPACPPRVRRALERWGYEPVVVDVSEFQKAGGAARCLTLALDVPAAAAGIAVDTAPADRDDPITLSDTYGARNYAPLPVAIAEASGAWVRDTEGRRYLDALSAYSALNFGHRHPALVAAARRQLDRVTLTSRAFHNDQLGAFCQELAALCGKDLVLPMNTGAEGVESAIKVARKWGYDVKGVAPGRAKVVVCAGNFHGRTISIVSFSDDPSARDGFGPYTPGFVTVPFGDEAALEAALADDDVVAFLVEPIQGEAGVIVPPDGYLAAARRLCTERDVLLIADEIQSGLGRTGRTFAGDHEGVVPDMYILGKALGGGIVPLSAVVADEAVLGVLHPGEHGSTFGGNPLACAVGRAVLTLLATGEPQERSARLGAQLLDRLQAAPPPLLRAVRGRGLWLGIDVVADGPPARAICQRLLGLGVLCKDAHGHTLRLAPPLTIGEPELDVLTTALTTALTA